MTKITPGYEYNFGASQWLQTVRPGRTPERASDSGEVAPGHPFLRLVEEQERIARLPPNTAAPRPSETGSGPSSPAGPAQAGPAQAGQVQTPASTPRPISAPMPVLQIPASFEIGHIRRLQAILQQQMWADEYNARIQWEFDHQKYNYEINAARGDSRMMEPEVPLFQTTDAMEIAKEMDRLEPAGSFMLSYEQVLTLAGGTGYQPETRGAGTTDAYFAMQERLLRPRVRG